MQTIEQPSNEIGAAVEAVVPHSTVRVAAPLHDKLELIGHLLNALHAADIRYCHWKSSEHLDASMKGETDLDILFDPLQQNEVAALLHHLGFKKFVAPGWRAYPGIADFIGLDLLSGKIIHVHAHFALTLGEAFLKGYQLPFVNQILAARVYDAAFDLYRISPAHELVLLYIRLALKTTHRDVLRFHLGKKPEYPANIFREYKWLKQRCTPGEVSAAIECFQLQQPSISRIAELPLSRANIIALRGHIRKALLPHKLYSPLEGNMLRWYREMVAVWRRKWMGTMRQPKPAKRTHPNGGLVIALIGADGSGKSTVIADLQATFKKKIDICTVYMGKGRAGGLSLSRQLLVASKKKYRTGKEKKTVVENAPLPAASTAQKPVKFSQLIYRCLEALIVANERNRKLAIVAKARKQGMLVICDRFPQNQQHGYNDGPALQHLRSAENPLLRAIASFENRVHRKAVAQPPDLVIKLVADPVLLRQRKPGTAALPILTQKVDGIKALHFAAPSVVVTIDAAKALQEVLAEVKGQLWNEWK